MYRITVYLLLFFIVFTHNAIAMDIHSFNILGEKSSSISDELSKSLSKSTSFEGHDDLNEHCPHNSSHTSGIVSSITLLSFEAHRAFIPVIKSKVYTVSQSPPLRPPKA